MANADIFWDASSSNEDLRTSEELDLIKRWSPMCNEVYA